MKICPKILHGILFSKRGIPMNCPLFSHAVTIEEAISRTNAIPVLPYNADPVLSKNPPKPDVKPIKPVQAFDNMYWIGTEHVGGILIKTSEGLVLIDTGSNDAEAEYMAESIVKLGLNPADIKLILISHEHFDHYGGLRWFLKNGCPKATVGMSRIGWNLLQTVPTEFAYIQPRPEKIDIFLEDGLCLKLGDTCIYCVFTPGHSPGCMSFIFNAQYQGKEIMVGMMGGSAAWPDLPELRQYQNSVEYFHIFTDIAHCNAYTGVHQSRDVIDRVRDSGQGIGANPWICTEEEFNAIYLQKYRDRATDTIRNSCFYTYCMPGRNADGSPVSEGSPIPEQNKESL